MGYPGIVRGTEFLKGESSISRKHVFATLLAALLLAGCGQKGEGGLTGTVNTDGSTSVADVVAVLQETFREKAPGVTVNYSGTGSGAGIEAVLSGACDIGWSSRALRAEEEAQGAAAQVVALDGVAVIVNLANPISDLTVEELALIFTGEISSWSQLGGGSGPIAVYGREAGSGTRSAFEDLLGVTDRCAYTNEYSSTGDVVGNVATNPNAIGYASLPAVGEGVSPLKVDGVACSEETVRDGSYPIQRPFLLVTKEGAALGEAAQAFIDFALSDEAADYIARAGAVAP